MKTLHLKLLILVLVCTQFANAKIPCSDQIKGEVRSAFSKVTGVAANDVRVDLDKKSLSQNGNIVEVTATASATHNYSSSEATYSVQFSPNMCSISTKQLSDVETQPAGACYVSDFNAHPFCLIMVTQTRCGKISFDNYETFGAFFGGPCGP